MMWGWWWLALPLMFVCMWMMGRMMGHRHSSYGSMTSESSRQRSGGAKRILAERLARGDIDVDEYERRLAALQTSDRDLDDS